jgi:prevent-host-death family protein
MESIGAFDAKTRLSELLDRTAHGETFEITKHGRAVGRLVPPDVRNRQASTAAAERLKAMSGIGGNMSREELKAMIHDGHRF